MLLSIVKCSRYVIIRSRDSESNRKVILKFRERIDKLSDDVYVTENITVSRRETKHAAC